MTGNDFVALAANAIDHAVLLTDAGGAIVYSNPAFCEMFGYAAGDIAGRVATEMLAQDGFDTGVIERARQELEQGRVFSEEVPVISKGGKQVWVAATVKPIFDSAGRLQNFLLVYSDINESKQIQSLQRDVLGAIAEDRPVRDVMELIAMRVEAIAPDVICSILAVDEDQRLRPMSAPQLPAAFSEAIDGLKIGPKTGSCGTAAFRGEPVLVTDIETDPLWEDFKALPLPLGLLACWSSPIMLRDGRVAGTFAFYYRQKQGPTAWHQHIVTACVDLCVIALERHEAKTRIAQLAYYDNLTGLPNRTLLREELVKSFDDVESPEAALIFLDIDRFKDVNDTLGHAVGDGFLKEIAERLRVAVWDVDFISRHGGDEFVIVLRGADAPRARAVAEKLLKAIDEPVVINGLALPASASIGIAVCPQDGRDAATLLRNADTAMYSAKADGRGTYRFFTAEMNRVAQDRLLLGSALRDAVENNELTLHYQPKIDARTGELAGVEALSRWTHPVLGNIAPDRFIPLAEDFGIIDRIGEFCLAEACHQLRTLGCAGAERAQRRGQYLAAAFPRSGAARIHRSDAQGLRPRSGSADRRDHRERDDGCLSHRHCQRQAIARERRLHLDGRFRHRLFELEPSGKAAGLRTQDRPQLHFQSRRQRSGARAGHGGDPYRRKPQALGRGRRRRDRAAAQVPRSTGLRPVAGLSVQPAAIGAGPCQMDYRPPRRDGQAG